MTTRRIRNDKTTLSPLEASLATGLSAKQIRRMVDRATVKAFLVPGTGRYRRIVKEDFIKYCSEHGIPFKES